MSENIKDCHLHLEYVSDGPNTCGTLFPIEHIPLDDPLHPEHSDNTQQRKTKAGDSTSKRCQVKSSTQSKSGKKTAAQEPTTDTNPNKKFLCTLSKFYVENSKHPPPVCFIYRTIYHFWIELSHLYTFYIQNFFCVLYTRRDD